MPKSFSILITFILIAKIVVSSQWKTVEMKYLKSTSKSNIYLNTFFSLTHFSNTNVIKIESKFKFHNLLIFLSSDKFKYCILPYLSSQNFIKIYLHFQNFIPEFNFQKFLPPSRFYTTNIVLDIQEPTTFLQPLEIYFLNQFEGEYSSLKSNILYFSQYKNPIIFEPHIPIPHDSICALLSQHKISTYETYAIPASCQELLILREDGSGHFVVTFQKSRDQFINIARGRGVSEKEFPDYVECVWEAYNLQGWKKHYWKLKSLLTVTYVKYLFCVVKIIFYLGSSLLHVCGNMSDFLEKADKSNYLCLQTFACLSYLLLPVPCLIIITGAGYIISVLLYYATILPFFILAFPLKHIVFGFTMYSFCFVSQTLASLYVCFFPQIKKCMPFSFGEMERIKLENILPDIVESFRIEPKQTMLVVPLLIQKRKKCWVEFLDTILMNFFIFGFGFLFSLLFWFIGIYF